MKKLFGFEKNDVNRASKDNSGLRSWGPSTSASPSLRMTRKGALRMTREKSGRNGVAMTKKMGFFAVKPFITLLLAIVFVFSLVFGMLSVSDNTHSAKANSSGNAIGEIYKGNGLFNIDNLNALAGTTGKTDLETLISYVKSGNTLNATGFKTNNGSGSVGITVTLGGYEWIPVYLSTSRNGEAVLDLLITEPQGNSQWNAWANDDSNTYTYPSSMYGSSLIRSYLMGTSYVATEGASTLTAGTQNETWKTFLTNLGWNSSANTCDFLLKPSEISYQETESGNTTLGLGNNYPNEAYSSTSVGGYYTGYDYTTKDTYTDWKNDYLWLPSLTELGLEEGTAGLWKLSTSQMTCSTRSWLRTGRVYYAGRAQYMDTLATGSTSVTTSYGVRPALHLNLDAVLKSTNSLGDLGGGAEDFSASTITNIAKSAGYSSIGELISDITANGSKDSTAFKYLSDGKTEAENGVVIKLGGLDWYPVYLTEATTGEVVLDLWLADDLDGVSVKFNTYTGATSANTYPSSMYGTSYVRGVLTGSQYATSSSALSTTGDKQNATLKTFIDNYGFYLIEPKYISYQETESAKEIIKGKSSGKAWTTYDLANEAWGTPSSAVYITNGNFTNKTRYTAWSSDKIWLPSFSEIGCVNSSTLEGYTSIWNITDSQRSSTSSRYWTRSNSVARVYDVYAGSDENYIYTTDVSTAYAVRPAIHLSLTNAAINAGFEIATTSTEELFDSSTNSLNQSALNQIAKSAGYADIDELKKAVKSGNLDSTVFSKDIYGNATTTSGITVTFGGLKWYPVYVTKTSATNKTYTVLDLWLADDLDSTGAQWNTYTDGTSSNAYPSSMYGTSYIRSYLVGSNYATSKTALSTTGVQNTNLATFLNTYGNYLIQPKYVKYQATESAVTQLGFIYSTPNDAYGTPTDVNWYTSNNFSSLTNYADWKNDKIWLPSITETGRVNENNVDAGMWNLSATQLSHTKATNSWLRSGFDITSTQNNAYYIESAGTNMYGSVTTTCGVRPAIHLSLDGVFEEESDQIGQTYTEKDGFTAVSLEQLAHKAGYDSMNALLDDIDNIATNPIKASVFDGVTIKLGSYTFNGKTYDLEWIPVLISTTTTTLTSNAFSGTKPSSSGNVVLTLMLASTETDNTSSNQEVSTWSDGTVEDTDSRYGFYPNSYDGSYIRHYILNGDTGYITFTSGTAITPPDSSTMTKFSMFTSGTLTQYLYKPSQVTWQTQESAYKNDLNYTGSGYQYHAWGNDYVWIPSLAETGSSSSSMGLFGMTNSQRSNSINTWTRTGRGYVSGVYTLTSTGDSYVEDYSNVNLIRAVRPCININLTNMAAAAGIGKANISTPKNSSIEYSTNDFSVEGFSSESWYNEGLFTNSSIMTVSFTQSGSEITPKGVGSYTVTFKILDMTNYCWDSGGTNDTITITLTIVPKVMSIPSISPTSVEYNGEEQSFVLDEYDSTVITVSPPSGMSLDGFTLKATKASDENGYVVSFSLKDTTNYVWSSDEDGVGGTGSKTRTVEITQKPLEFNLTLENDVPTWGDDGTPTGYSIDTSGVVGGDNGDDIHIVYHYVNKDDGTETYSGTTPPTRRGNYTLTVEIVDPSGNYSLSDKTVKSYDYSYAGTAIVPFSEDSQLVWKYDNGGVNVMTVEYVAGTNEYRQYASDSPFTVEYSGNAYTFYVDETALATHGLKVKEYSGTTTSTDASSTTLSVSVTFDELDTTWADYTSTTPYVLYWKIDKAKFDLSSVAWSYEKAFTFTGEAQKVELHGVPEGLSVTYDTKLASDDDGAYTEGNSQQAVGEYQTKVIFAIDTSADSKYANYYVPTASGNNYKNTGSTFSFTVVWEIDKATIYLNWVMEYKTDSKGVQFRVPELEDTQGIVDYEYYLYDADADDHLGEKLVNGIDDIDGSVVQRYMVLAILENVSSYQFSDDEDSINPRAFTVGKSTEDVEITVTTTAVYNGKGQAIKIKIANAADTTCTVNMLVVTYKDSSGAPLADSTLPTNAGTYTATIDIADSYSDYYKLTSNKIYSYTISKKQLDLSSIVWDYSTPYTYQIKDGQAVEYTVALTGFNSETQFLKDGVTYNGEYSATDAGTYTATYKINVDTTNYEIKTKATASSSLDWTINKQAITKPTSMLESFTYNGLAHNLIEMCVEPENTLPTNWEDYLSVVTFKDGADFDDPTAVTDAGKYALAFSIKDTKNVTWVDSSGARDALTYTVYCVIEPKVLIIECWSDKPGEPVFSETVASKYYKLVYTDASGKEITKNEATKAYGQTCRVTITVPDGMEGNVELRAVSGIGLYEDFICYDITTDIPTLLTKPQLVKTQIEYTGNDISILDYMNTDYNANYMYISGNISVISVGEDYTVYVMISGLVNATWADKTTGALCLKFSVIKANVEEEWDTSQRVPFLVGGESLVDYVYYDLSGKKIASEDLVEGVQYYVSAVVKDEYKESFSFANGTAESTKYQFKVTPPVAVIIPTMANYSLVYNAQSQTFALSGVDASYVEYNADELTQTEAGVYYVTVSLKSGSYAVWDDETGGTDTRRIQFVITKKAVEVDWDMSTALPSLNLHGVIPNTAVTYKYYDSNGNQVGANALKEGEAYTIKAVISDEYAKNYMFGDSSDTTSEAKSFTYIKGDTDTALSDDDNSIKKLGGLSIPSDFPLWQIIVGSISFVVGFIAYVQAGINNRAARRMNRRTNHMKCSTVGVGLALLALFGIENVGWTVIAIVLLALCILGIGAWIVSKIKRAVAEDRMDHYNNGSYNGGNGYNGGGGSSGYNGGYDDGYDGGAYNGGGYNGGSYNGGGGMTDDDGFYENYNNDPKG